MARTQLAVQQAVPTGLALTFTAAAVDGHAFSNANGNVAIYVKNASASPIDVTISTPITSYGLAVADLVVSVPNAGERIIGPFPKVAFNQSSVTPALEDAVYLNTSAQASVTYAAFEIT